MKPIPTFTTSCCRYSKTPADRRAKNTIIITTSNLGARFLEKRGHLGFSTPMGEGIPTKIEDIVRSEVKKASTPSSSTDWTK